MNIIINDENKQPQLEEKIILKKTDILSELAVPNKIQSLNLDRDVNIGLDLLANTEKHIPNISSPTVEVKLPSASIINSMPENRSDIMPVNRSDIMPDIMPKLLDNNILSPNKVWSDVNTNNVVLNNIDSNKYKSVKPNLSNIEIDLEPPIIVKKPIQSPSRIKLQTPKEEFKVKKPLSPIKQPDPSSKEIYFKKVELLQKMNKIKRMGFVVPELSANDDYDTIKIEYDKIKKMKDSENSIKFSRKMLLAIVTAIEFLNNKFDPFDLELNGWSESVNENVDDYDDIFEMLADKYKGTSNMAPELKLLLMLGGSGFMFHLSNSMFKKMQNPDSMLNGMMGNLMGGLAGGGSGGGGSNTNPMESMMGAMMGGGGSNNGGSNNKSSGPRTNRKEMSGPSGVDDILQHLQARTTDNKKEPSVSSHSRKNKSKGVSITL